MRMPSSKGIEIGFSVCMTSWLALVSLVITKTREWLHCSTKCNEVTSKVGWGRGMGWEEVPFPSSPGLSKWSGIRISHSLVSASH